MTICVTACVPEGIVMGIDSRLTETITYFNGQIKQKNLSDTHTKLWLLNESYGLMAHGPFDYYGKDMNIIIDEFKKTYIRTNDDVYLVAYKLNSFIINKYPSLGTQFWLAGIDEGRLNVYHISKEKYELTNYIDGEIDYGFHFGGNENGTNIAKNYVEEINEKYSEMSLNRAEELTKTCIELVISTLNSKGYYSDCGGEIKIFIISQTNSEFKVYR